MGTVPDLRTERSGVVESGLSLFCLQRGFTLIELLVVLSILSITISFVVPRLMGKEEAELKSASRKLLYTVRRLSDEALFRKEKRVLNIDIKNGEYREGDDGKKLKLPDGLQVENVSLGKEDISRGVASISFFPSGVRFINLLSVRIFFEKEVTNNNGNML